MNNNAVDLLLKERDKLVIERNAVVSRFNADIQSLESSIEKISGKKVWEIEQAPRYDDEHPDYIKASIED